jgi:Fur family ferric uptake transcriptional regulator
MEEIKQVLQRSGLKATKSRVKVLAMLKEDHVPKSIEDMQKALKQQSPDRVTLYRMMQQFYQAQLVKRVDFREGFERFEFQDHHHHHIVCTGCGVIEAFDLCDAENISHRILVHSRKFSVISDHSLELFGLCNSCVKA